jgi:hypothetical protein
MLNATDEKTVDLRLAATGEMVEVMTPSWIETLMTPEMIGEYEKLCSLDINFTPEVFTKKYDRIMDRLVSLMFDQNHPTSWISFAAYIWNQVTWEPFEDRARDRQQLREYLISNVDTTLLVLSTWVTLTRSPAQVLSSYTLAPIIQYFQNATFGGKGTDWKEDITYRNTREQHIKYYNEYKYALLSLDDDSVSKDLYGDDYKNLIRKIDADWTTSESSKKRNKIRQIKKLYASKLKTLWEAYKERNEEFMNWNPITNEKYGEESFGDKMSKALERWEQDNSCMARLQAIMRHEWSIFGRKVTFQDMIRDETNDGENSDFLGAIKKILWYYIAESILYENSESIREFRKEQVDRLMRKMWIIWFVDTLAQEWNLADRQTVEKLSTAVFWMEFSWKETSEDAGE